MSVDAEIVQVRLIGFPVRVYAQAQEHADDLMREFALLTLAQDDDEQLHATPRRLLRLVDDLTERYGSNGAADAQRDAAVASGEGQVDLVYPVPRSARDSCILLSEMLDAADEYCRRGEHLLTLATPMEAKRFRDWYLGEFVAQIDGRRPTPWSAYAASSAG